MTDDLTRAPRVGKLDVVIKYLINPDVFMNEDNTSGPSTSRVQAEKEELKRRLAIYEGQVVEPEAESVVPDVETIREVERKLSPLDKVLQLQLTVLYSRANDATMGCNYLDERKSAVRNLATPFNMVINSHLSTRSNLVSKALLDSINMAKDIGFDVRAVVCDRNTTYKEAVHTLPRSRKQVAFDQAHEVFYSALDQKMIEKNIGKRIQATVVAELVFFKTAGSCSRGMVHRRNLLGFMLFMLLRSKNRESDSKNVLRRRPPPHINEDPLYPKVKFIMAYAYRGATHLKQFARRLSRYLKGGVENRARKQAIVLEQPSQFEDALQRFLLN
uniref:Uncharacterized protein n=1 Tax=Glossina palpalis gambiensis TaxID=67801 RepID=A0A1B0C334_9MUSC